MRTIPATRVPEAAPIDEPELPNRNGNRTADGLPIRIRQASVARTLPESTDDTIEVPPTAAARTPEQMRNMLASFQSGMNQGRAAAAAQTDDPQAGAAFSNGANGDQHYQPDRTANGGAHRADTDMGAAPEHSTEEQSAVVDGGPPMAKGGGNDDY
jgi:hypothetical protein